jgi:hypothetical protein
MPLNQMMSFASDSVAASARGFPFDRLRASSPLLHPTVVTFNSPPRSCVSQGSHCEEWSHWQITTCRSLGNSTNESMTKQSHFTNSLMGASQCVAKKTSVKQSEQGDCFADAVRANLPMVKRLPQLRLAMTGLRGVL